MFAEPGETDALVGGDGRDLSSVDVMVVPALAIDPSGHRIGYGAGYYDLTLAALRAHKAIVAIGVAFAAQEIAAVPATPHDAPLDLVLTEREVIDLRRA